MPDAPDRDVLDRFVHGDREAFERLFHAHQQEVFRWALRVVRDRSAAEDVVVEAFWRAHRSRARFDPSRSFGAWMRRIATRAAIDHLNAARRRGWVSLDDLSNRVGRVPLHEQPATSIGPADAIRLAFRGLPAKLQVVAVLALIEEEPLAAIAEALDLPIGTVKSRLFRATRQLRKELARLGVHA